MPRRPHRLGLEALEDRATPAYGLDPTFSDDGLLQMHLGNSTAPVDTVVQPDGRILVVESTENGIVIVRMNPDGSPDLGFGTEGRADLSDIPLISTSVALGPDGLIYVLAPSLTEAGSGVYRLTPDGHIDTTFGTDGHAATPFRSFQAGQFTVQPDGKIVLVGTTQDYFTPGYPATQIAVARLLPTGEADPSFGDGGRFHDPGRLNWWPANGSISAVAVAPDGKLVVGFTTSTTVVSNTFPWASLKWEVSVMRISSDGALDPTFSGDGVWIAGGEGGPPFDNGGALAIRPDGKILVAGVATSTNYETSVVQLNTDGSVDTEFGDGGQSTAFSQNAGYISAALLPDGRVVVTTSSVSFGPQTFHVVILGADGSRDPAFVNGLADLGIEFPGEGSGTLGDWSRIDDSESLAITPDGRIIIAGKTYNHLGPPSPYESPFAKNDLIVAVLSDTVTLPPIDPPLPVDPPPGTGETPHPGAGIDPMFGIGGRASVPRDDFYGGSVVAGIAPDGRIVIATQNYGPSGIRFVVNRLTPDGAIDPTFGTDGTATIDLAPLGYGADILRAAVGLADGSVLLLFGAYSADAATSLVYGADFGVIRLTPDGLLDTTFDGDGLAVISMSTEPAWQYEDGRDVIYYPNSDYPMGMAVAPDGKLVIVGTVYRGVGVVRLNTDGSLDTSFDGDGKQTIVFGTATPYLPNGGYASAVAVAADGSIVVAASVGVLDPGQQWLAGQDMGVARLTSNGQLDATFGTNGIRVVDLDSELEYETAAAVAFAPDGGIFLGGTAGRSSLSTGDFAVVKLTAAGEFDAGFGDGGVRFVAFDRGPNLQDQLHGMTVDADGRVTLFGVVQNRMDGFVVNWVPYSEWAFARLNADGSPDESFGPCGRLILRGEQSDTPAFAVQPDGKIIVAELTGISGPIVVPYVICGPGNTYFCGTPYGPSPPDFGSREVHLIRVTDDLPDRPEWPPLPLPVDPPIYYPSIFLPTEPPLPVGPLPGTGEAPPLPVNVPPDPGATPPLPTEPLPVPAEPLLPPAPLPLGPQADFNHDSINDRVFIDGSRVGILDGNTAAASTDGPFVVAPFAPFEDSFQGKLNVTAGDLTGDGIADLVVAADDGGGPVVVVYDGAKLAAGVSPADAQLVRFLGIDDTAFRGGARIALGDLNHDGVLDLFVAAGKGGGPRLAIYDGVSVVAGTPTRLVPDFFVFEDTQRDGAFLTAGDINGDGFADLACGGGPNGGPRVLVLDGKMLVAGQTAAAFAAPIANFFADDPDSRNGVMLGITNADADNCADLVVIDPAAGEAHLYRGADLDSGGEPPPLPFDGLLDGVFVG